MTRNVRAARVLAQQLNARAGRKPDSKASAEVFTVVGEPDGFGVNRSFTFDKTVSKGLADLLGVLGDERIESVAEEKGQVTITFSPRTVADDPRPFGLDVAEEALAQAEAGQVEEPEE